MFRVTSYSGPEGRWLSTKHRGFVISLSDLFENYVEIDEVSEARSASAASLIFVLIDWKALHEAKKDVYRAQYEACRDELDRRLPPSTR